MVQLTEMVSLNIYILYIQYIYGLFIMTHPLSDGCKTHYVTVY